MTETTPPRLDRRRVALGLVAAVVVGGVLVFSIGRFAGFTEIRDALRGAQWQWLTLCVVGQAFVFVGYAGAFRSTVTFEGGPDVSSRRSLHIILASFSVTQLVAAGGAAGLAITYWALSKLGFARREAMVRLIALNTAVYLVFGLLGWTAALVALVIADAPLGMTLPWLIGIPIVIVVARWFTDPERAARWATDTGGLARRGLGTGVAAAWSVRRALAHTEGRGVFVWSWWYWAGDVLSLWAALHAFGARPGIVAIALAYATGYLAQAIPVPLIATGGVDAATTFALTAVGVPVELALLGVIAHRIFAFWLPIGPGLWSAVRLVRPSDDGWTQPVYGTGDGVVPG